MELIKVKPTTNGTRHLIKLNKSVLLKDDRFLKMRKPLKKYNGRSSITGHITSWHKGNGHKQLYRPTNSIEGNKYSIIIGIGHNPKKNSLVAAAFDFLRRKYYYTTAVLGSSAGSLIKENVHSGYSTQNANSVLQSIEAPKLGSKMCLDNIPIGSIICNISLSYFSKPKFACSAGTKAQLIRRIAGVCTVKIATSILITLPGTAHAQLGTMSNDQYRSQVFAKAGRLRNLGRRPTVRGIAMNPVDHPHGGKTNGGMPSVTPWGKVTKCRFTLRKKKQNKFNIKNYV